MSESIIATTSCHLSLPRLASRRQVSSIESEGVGRRIAAETGSRPDPPSTGARRLLAGTLQEAKIAARWLRMRRRRSLEPVESDAEDTDEVQAALTASPKIKRPGSEGPGTNMTMRN